jgi:hypothetical protein
MSTKAISISLYFLLKQLRYKKVVLRRRWKCLLTDDCHRGLPFLISPWSGPPVSGTAAGQVPAVAAGGCGDGDGEDGCGDDGDSGDDGVGGGGGDCGGDGGGDGGGDQHSGDQPAHHS